MVNLAKWLSVRLQTKWFDCRCNNIEWDQVKEHLNLPGTIYTFSNQFILSTAKYYLGFVINDMLFQQAAFDTSNKDVLNELVSYKSIVLHEQISLLYVFKLSSKNTVTTEYNRVQNITYNRLQQGIKLHTRFSK